MKMKLKLFYTSSFLCFPCLVFEINAAVPFSPQLSTSRFGISRDPATTYGSMSKDSVKFYKNDNPQPNKPFTSIADSKALLRAGSKIPLGIDDPKKNINFPKITDPLKTPPKDINSNTKLKTSTKSTMKSTINELSHQHGQHNHSPHTSHKHSSHKHAPHAHSSHEHPSESTDNISKVTHGDSSSKNGYPRIILSGNTALLVSNEYQLNELNRKNTNNNSSKNVFVNGEKIIIMIFSTVGVLILIICVCFISYSCK